MSTSTPPALTAPLTGRDAQADAPVSAVRQRLARILQGRDFPALSQQIAETITALEDDASSMQRLTNVVLREYSLTLSVVRTANSAHYRRADRQIQSVTRAMMLLGARTVRQLASSILLFENYRKHSAGLKELMLLSLLTANHAREVAVKLGLTDPEEVHLCGMCRNLGEVLIACHFPVDYARIRTLVHDRHHHEASAALAVLGFRYEDMGEEMCRHWGMPDSVLQGMRARATRVTTQASAITAFAHELTTVIYRRDAGAGAGASDARKDLDLVISRYAPRFRLNRKQVGEVIALALDETHELFVTAGVRVDELRMQQLSTAACSALGVTTLAHAEWEAEPGGASGLATAALRDRLRLELESKVDPASGCDLGQVLLLALEGALRGAPFDRVVACVLSPDRSRLRARSGLGVGVESLLAQFDFPMTPQGGPVPAALLHERSLYLPVARPMNAMEQRLASKLGITQFGVFPIIVDGQVVGCLYGDRVAHEPLPDGGALAHLEALTLLVVQAISARRTAPLLPPPAPLVATRPGGVAELTERQVALLEPETRGALVLRLIKGETLVAVAGSSGVPAERLDAWRSEFLAGAMARLAGA